MATEEVVSVDAVDTRTLEQGLVDSLRSIIIKAVGQGVDTTMDGSFINRGHPSFIVMDGNGTYMLTVEKISGAVMKGQGEPNAIAE